MICFYEVPRSNARERHSMVCLWKHPNTPHEFVILGAEWSTVRFFGDLLAFPDSVYHSTKVSCGTKTVGYGSICHVAGGDKVNILTERGVLLPHIGSYLYGLQNIMFSRLSYIMNK